MGTMIRLCSLAKLKEDIVIGFDPFNVGADTIFALYKEEQVFLYKNQCPHDLVAMEYKKNQFLSKDRQQIICYAHGARFDPVSGLCIHGPCLGMYLPKVDFVIIDGDIYLNKEALETFV